MGKYNSHLVKMVRKTHVIGYSGVGAIIVTNLNGITGMVCGVSEWMKNNNFSSVAVNDYIYHNRRVEKMYGVDGLLTPPTYEVKTSNSKSLYWEIPLRRFPDLEYCTTRSCSKIRQSHGGYMFAEKCNNDSYHKNSKRVSYSKQIPLVAFCSDGHIERLPVGRIAHGGGKCQNADATKYEDWEELKYIASENVDNPTIECLLCGSSGKVRPSQEKTNPESDEAFSEGKISYKCGGQKPWLYSKEPCSNTLTIAAIDSTLTYSPVVHSYIYIPSTNTSGLSDSLISAIEEMREELAFDKLVKANMHEDVLELITKKHPKFSEATVEDVKQHCKTIMSPTEDTEKEQSPIVVSQIEELNTLLDDSYREDKFSTQRILEKKNNNIEEYQSPLIGENKLIIKNVSIYRLTEDRIFAGFKRFSSLNPKNKEINPYSDSLQIKEQLWGTKTPQINVIPAVRVYGEGIFLQLNIPNQIMDEKDFERRQSEKQGIMSRQKFVFAHTLAHTLINQLALESGYSTTEIKDKIYEDEIRGRIGILLYVSSMDTAGTMGGLVDLARHGKFENILHKAIEKIQWCPLDPVCMDPITNGQTIRTPGACHHCLYLPETACLHFNQGLDRKMLHEYLQANNIAPTTLTNKPAMEGAAGVSLPLTQKQKDFISVKDNYLNIKDS